MNPPDVDKIYVQNKACCALRTCGSCAEQAPQVNLMSSPDDSVQFAACKELSALSDDVPATGLSAGALGLLLSHTYDSLI